MSCSKWRLCSRFVGIIDLIISFFTGLLVNANLEPNQPEKSLTFLMLGAVACCVLLSFYLDILLIGSTILDTHPKEARADAKSWIQARVFFMLILGLCIPFLTDKLIVLWCFAVMTPMILVVAMFINEINQKIENSPHVYLLDGPPDKHCQVEIL